MLHTCLTEQVKAESWEADFDADMPEDGPSTHDKEVHTTKQQLGRKDLLQTKSSTGDEASTPLLPTTGKRKPSRPPQEASSKRSASTNKIGASSKRGLSHLQGQKPHRRLLLRHCRKWHRRPSQLLLHCQSLPLHHHLRIQPLPNRQLLLLLLL